MSSLLVVFKEANGQTVNVPFTYKDGSLLEALERMASFFVDTDRTDMFWEGVAIDRLNVILKQQQQINELKRALMEVRA